MKLVIFTLMVLTTFGLSAQSLRGNLKSKKSESALGYGNVDIYQEDVLVASVLTDHLGNFNVALDTGEYKCVINYAGHKPIEKIVRIDNDEKSDFSMEEDPTKPPMPIITSHSYEYEDASRTLESHEISEVAVVRTRGGRRYKDKRGRPGGSVETVSGLSSMSVDGGTYSIGDVGGGGSARSGALTAGEINDFSKWELWEDMSRSELKSYSKGWGLEPMGRYTLSLKSQAGLPLADAVVKLMLNAAVLYTARTDNTGKAELWASISGDSVVRNKLSMEIDYMGQKETIRNVKPFNKSVNHLVMEVGCYELNNVDIAFVVDATGSMGDELSYLKAEMNDVIFKSKQISSKLNFRFANVFYRDKGDAYLTQTMGFSRVLSESVQFINGQHAGGGGDYEEAVEVGLDSAINNLEWSEAARSRILFLILDAPPHNTAENRKKLSKLMKQAAEKGIRIVPVGASGINKLTEYLMRSLAIGTNGTYTFLTDHSGIGNTHIEPTTDSYKVETFNDVLVRILKSYTYMPDCDQSIPDLQLDYPDSLVTIPNDSIQDTDTNTVRNHHHTNPFPEISWSFYPNPTTGILNITADDDIKEIFLTDLSGKLLTSIKDMKKDRVYQMDLTEYTTGIYLLRYLHNDRWISGKVMLQR